ncbi:hypothetical protein K9857_22185 [Pseudomonas sp. REP124]|uniref:fibronectin type III domain-containing protein n=1 Tax=Pseudomonas sp. REP124 TaxID=2875731 RepID=UPI001CCE609D|nr:hypothetical protein [Pseudomonas sp. REP124]MBZ9784248.1 hypothetical protein [Pseudomonas sp. REP124]
MTSEHISDPNTQALESASVPLGERNINYSRWMTDMFNDISHLMLWQLALPSAHNSGADKGAIDFIGEKWTACQDGRFSAQLNAGARVVDLRMKDNSYGEVVGNHAPHIEFRERIEFKHGSWGNRLLQHLISDVLDFCRANPGEIVVLDFHSYDKGTQYAFNSLERVLKHLETLKSFLLPRVALGKTMQQIYTEYPGKNIILAFDYGASDKWPVDKPERALLWDLIGHRWNHDDYSEAGIEEMVVEAMRSPPLNFPWALSSTVYKSGIDGGPQHLPANHPIRTIPFSDSGRKVNIVMADFIQRADSRIGVVDRCIALNLQMGRDKTPPSAPTGFIVRQQRLTDEGAKQDYYQNTTRFYWDASKDDTAVRYYEIFQNGARIYTVSGTELLVKDFNKVNGPLKVRAVDMAGNVSDFSSSVDLTQDSVPPTNPADLKFARFGYPTIKVEWAASSDGNGVGVAGYEVRINDVYQGFTAALSYEFHNTSPNQSYLIEVRAKDRNGNYSEWTGLNRPPLPRLQNTRIDYIPLDWDPNLFNAVITWDSIPILLPLGMQIALQFITDSVPLPLIPFDPTYPPTYKDYAMPGDKFIVKARVFIMNTGEESEQVVVSLDVDVTKPLPASNFKIASQTDTDMVLSWDKSASTDVASYAISVSEKPPFIVPASRNEFPVSKLASEATYPIRIWAIDHHGNLSLTASLTASGGPEIPDKPGAPTKIAVSAGTISAQIGWLPPAGNSITYAYYLEGQQEKTTAERNVIVDGLSTNTDYTFVVFAVSSSGERSDPATATFKTMSGSTIPSDFHVTNNSNRSVSFAWGPPRNNAENVLGYTFKIFPSGDSTPLSAMSHTANNLLVGLPMIFGVQCRFRDGTESEWNKITVIPLA